jgi:hypothetical protein
MAGIQARRSLPVGLRGERVPDVKERLKGVIARILKPEIWVREEQVMVRLTGSGSRTHDVGLF